MPEANQQLSVEAAHAMAEAVIGRYLEPGVDPKLVLAGELQPERRAQFVADVANSLISASRHAVDGAAPAVVHRCETCAAPKAEDLEALWVDGLSPKPEKPAKKPFSPVEAEMARLIAHLRKPWWLRAAEGVSARFAALVSPRPKVRAVIERHPGATDGCLAEESVVGEEPSTRET